MKIIKREFSEHDFIRVRDFITQTYNNKYSNWHIDRWNFCRYFAQPIVGTYNTWAETVGMWVDECSNIVSIVNSEGENNGEVFFQLSDVKYEDGFINEMIDFAEQNLYKMTDSKKEVLIRVDNKCNEIIENLIRRGYEKEKWNETDLVISLNKKFEVSLDSRFKICDANSVNDEQKGLAHIRAFNHTESYDYADLESRKNAYKKLRTAPDYKSELDLCIVDDNNEICSFATVWYDEINQIGILEPVGTVPKYRYKGLGKSVIYEGINRIEKLGATKMYVGSNQEFYKKIGFNVDRIRDVWHKTF